jgi:hypothetical protein
LPADTRRQENEHWPKLLAFPFHNVTHDLVEKHYVAFHQAPEFLLKQIHFSSNRGLYISNSKGHWEES